jgi:hypothetical protein
MEDVQSQMNRMRQEHYDMTRKQAEHIADLTKTFLHKRVKPSEISTRHLRDSWQGCGREPQKSRLKKAYEKQAAQRGTVQEILLPDHARGVSAGLRVQWDEGFESKCLSYMVEIAED